MNSTKKNWIASIRKQPPEDLMKISIDASRRHANRCVMRDNHVKITMTKGKQIEDCPILVMKCLTVGKTIMIMIQKNLQLVVHSIKDMICVSKNIINLVKEIKILSYFFSDIRIEFRQLINKEADATTKNINQ